MKTLPGSTVVMESREAGLTTNLLSDHVGIVAGFDFEAAVLGPQIDGVGDTGDAPFVNLTLISTLV